MSSSIYFQLYYLQLEFFVFIFVSLVGKHDPIQKSWHHLQQVYGSLQNLNCWEWPSKLVSLKHFVQIKEFCSGFNFLCPGMEEDGPNTSFKHFLEGLAQALCLQSVKRMELNPQPRAPRERADCSRRMHKSVLEAVGWNPGVRQGLRGFKWLKVPRGSSHRPLSCISISPLPHLNLVTQFGIFHWISVEFGY